MIYLVFKKKNKVLWQAEAGFDAWNLYKGDLDVLVEDGIYTQAPGSNPIAAHQCGLIDPKADDPVAPPVGKVAFYLATGLSAGVEGDLGTDSDGVPRPQDMECTEGP